MKEWRGTLCVVGGRVVADAIGGSYFWDNSWMGKLTWKRTCTHTHTHNIKHIKKKKELDRYIKKYILKFQSFYRKPFNFIFTSQFVCSVKEISFNCKLSS